MKHGTRLAAGHGATVVIADMDFETYSEAGLVFDFAQKKWRGASLDSKKKGLSLVGVAVYARHPTTEVLYLAYDLKEGLGPRQWLPGLPLPTDLFQYLDRGGLVEAWSASFEWWVWNEVCVEKYGFPPLPMPQMRCAAAKARASGWPGSLGKAGAQMGLKVKKDFVGSALIDKLSVPRNPTKADPSLRLTREAAPELYAQFAAYNITDILSESEASSRCPDLVGEELEYWLLDQTINRRGVAVDVEGAGLCAQVVRECLAAKAEELTQLTGGLVTAPSELQALARWLRTQGIPVAEGEGALSDEAIEGWLKVAKEGTAAHAALRIRQEAGSASVKKVFAMISQMSEGRLHDMYVYHGARTGRPTGEGPQPTNLPKAGPKVRLCASCGKHTGLHAAPCGWCGALPGPGERGVEWCPDGVEDALGAMREGGYVRTRHMFGDALLAVSGCLRGLFTASPGNELISSDYSSIEGVVTAYLAGEEWRIEMFRTHAKAYELSVSMITGLPFAEIMAHAGYDDVESPEWWLKKPLVKKPHHPLRQTLGKVAELASGFGGWIGAWKNFGADSFMSDDEIKAGILGWRKASPAIVHFWGGQPTRYNAGYFGLEGAAVLAVMNPGVWQKVMRLDGTHTGISYYCDATDRALYCQLPSDRILTYRNPRLVDNPRTWGGAHQLKYEGWNTNPKNGPTGWITIDTYGGKLCENVVQAVARDIQRHGKLNVERGGYLVVMHTYDEIVSDVARGYGSVEEFERLMGQMPPWATYRGLPWAIRAAGGWRGKRYRKD